MLIGQELTDGTTGIDQPAAPSFQLTAQGTEVVKYEKDYVFDLVDRAIEASIEEESFDLAFFALEKMRAMNQASALGACKILHGVKSNWDKVPHKEGETFIGEAVRKSGYAALTVERYVDVWELLTGDYIPAEFLKNFENQTMRQLVKEASLVVTQEYELTHDDWRDLSEAADEHRVAEVAARVKGSDRNKNHMSLRMDESGSIFAVNGKGEEGLVGHLRLSDKSKLIQGAIKRIVNSAQIKKDESEY